MNEKAKIYVSEICKYYGYAFSIPIGQYFLKLVFQEEVAVDSFLFSFVIFLFGIIFFNIGIIISNDI